MLMVKMLTVTQALGPCAVASTASHLHAYDSFVTACAYMHAESSWCLLHFTSFFFYFLLLLLLLNTACILSHKLPSPLVLERPCGLLQGSILTKCK